MIDEHGSLQASEAILIDENPTSITAGADEMLFYTTEDSQGKTTFLQYSANNQQSETLTQSDGKMTIIGHNHDATYLYIAERNTLITLVHQWNIKNGIITPENSARLLGTTNDIPGSLLQTTDDNHLFALTSDSAADNGVIPVYATIDL